MVGAEAPQAVLDLEPDGFGAEVAADLLPVEFEEGRAAAVLPPEPALGRQHGLVAAALERASDDLLAVSMSVTPASMAAWIARTDCSSSEAPHQVPPPSAHAPKATAEALIPVLPISR
jgi:hypothetical protein